MKGSILKTMTWAGLLLGAVTVFGLYAHGQGNGARAIEGVWEVTVTIRSCSTGDAIRSFPRLLTVSQGGTLGESAAAGTAAQPALRGPGHGVWDHGTERNFSYAVQFLRLNADGSPAGRVKERRTVEVDLSGGSFVATGTGEVFNASGTLLFSSCATEEGIRFQ